MVKFRNINDRFKLLQSRENNTHEKVFEYEFYSIMIDLESLLDAFEYGIRKPLKPADYYEFLSQLKRCYDMLKKNIEHLEEMWQYEAEAKDREAIEKVKRLLEGGP